MHWLCDEQLPADAFDVYGASRSIFQLPFICKL